MNENHQLSFTLDKNNFLTVKLHHGKRYTVIGKGRIEDCCNRGFTNQIWEATVEYHDKLLDIDTLDDYAALH